MTEERILTAIAAEDLEPSPQSLAEFYTTLKVNGVHSPIAEPAPAAARF